MENETKEEIKQPGISKKLYNKFKGKLCRKKKRQREAKCKQTETVQKVQGVVEKYVVTGKSQCHGLDLPCAICDKDECNHNETCPKGGTKESNNRFPREQQTIADQENELPATDSDFESISLQNLSISEDTHDEQNPTQSTKDQVEHFTPLIQCTPHRTDTPNLLASFLPPDATHQKLLCDLLEINPKEENLGKLVPVNSPCYSPHHTYVTVGDGHCFYRAISFCITGTEDHHPHLRKVLHKHMWTHANSAEILGMNTEQFQNYIVTRGPVNQYNKREYATDVEIFFMSDLLQTNIAVYRYADQIGWHLHEKNWLRQGGGLCLSQDFNTNETTIYINNPGANHYDVVISTHLEGQQAIEQPINRNLVTLKRKLTESDEPGTSSCKKTKSTTVVKEKHEDEEMTEDSGEIDFVRESLEETMSTIKEMRLKSQHEAIGIPQGYPPRQSF